MARWMRIEGNIAVNAEEWDATPDVPGVIHVRSDTAHIGASYDPGTGILTDPPAPAPPRPDLPKSVVVQRLQALGVANSVFSALQAQPAEFALWFSPDWPRVYKDDANLLALLQGVGLTSAQIAQVVA